MQSLVLTISVESTRPQWMLFIPCVGAYRIRPKQPTYYRRSFLNCKSCEIIYTRRPEIVNEAPYSGMTGP